MPMAASAEYVKPAVQPAVAQPAMVQPQVVMGQPAGPQYGMPVQPQMMAPVQPMPVQPISPAPNVVHVHHVPGPVGYGGPTGPGVVPPGAPEGGQWMVEPYCGDTTMIALIVTFFVFTPAMCCIPCCKCDQRQVYLAPNGLKYLPNGAIAPPDACC